MKRKYWLGRDSAAEIASRVWRLFWLVVLVAHVFLAVGWWWLEPGGLHVRHPRFWVEHGFAPLRGSWSRDRVRSRP